jgi:hypothetical protein
MLSLFGRRTEWAELLSETGGLNYQQQLLLLLSLWNSRIEVIWRIIGMIYVNEVI